MSRRKKLELDDFNLENDELSKEEASFWASRKDVRKEVKLKKAKDIKRAEKWKEDYSKAKAKKRNS